eukprot:6189934-Pyramimonas_sp.AAC.1
MPMLPAPPEPVRNRLVRRGLAMLWLGWKRPTRVVSSSGEAPWLAYRPNQKCVRNMLWFVRHVMITLLVETALVHRLTF